MPYNIGKLRYWKNRHLSLQHKLKISKSLARIRVKRSRIIKRAYREGRLQIWNRGKHLPASIKSKISETKKRQCRTEAFRKKTSRFFRNYWKEHPKKHKEIMDKTINLWKRDKKRRKEINRKISIGGRMRFKNPEERLRMRGAVKDYWQNHPNLDYIWRKRMLLYYALHRKARNRLLEHNNNPFRQHIKTKAGYLVRSKGEAIISNALTKLGEEQEYEKQPLFFPEDSCIPDFWLPKRRVLIEFYGGYPKSWKKKVAKNKIYNKYKIPVIAITPAELINIEGILRREIKKQSGNFSIKRWQNPLVMANKEEMKIILNMFPKLR